MSDIAVRAEEIYDVLCRVLEKNEIPYDKTSGKSVVCRVSGRGGDIRMSFCADISKMLVTVYAPVARHIPEERISDLSLALCMLNHKIQDGAFCLDMTDGILYYRMTCSYYNSIPQTDSFVYMLSGTAEAVDAYRSRLLRICYAPVQHSA